MYAALHSASASPRLAECARDFSPLVEETSPATVTFDVAGLAHLFGDPDQLAAAIARRAAGLGLEDARVALASNPDAAIHAARGIPGVTVIPPGREAQILGPLPVSILEPSEDLAATLARWGIRTLAQLAALPGDGLAARLGPEGVRLHEHARGAARRPLKPFFAPTLFEEALDLEYPVTLLEPLAFLLGRMLNDLCTKLDSHGLATHELRLTLALEQSSPHQRSIRLPYPMRDAKVFLKLFTLDLDLHPPGAPVTGVALALEPVDPRVVQHGLFLPLAPEPQKLELTLARLTKLAGEGNAGAAELSDTHRPGAFVMKRFSPPPPDPRPRERASPRAALRIFRPPVPAGVHAPHGRPERVHAPGISGAVVESAGPWRTSGDWWRADPWSRDEWDVLLSTGALHRIYRDRFTNSWYLEATYD